MSALPDYQPALGEDPEPLEPTFADGGVTRHHTARKALWCDNCPADRGIQPGERYCVSVGVDGWGGFFCERSCARMAGACRAALPPEPARAAPCGQAVPYDPDHLSF